MSVVLGLRLQNADQLNNEDCIVIIDVTNHSQVIDEGLSEELRAFLTEQGDQVEDEGAVLAVSFCAFLPEELLQDQFTLLGSLDF